VQGALVHEQQCLLFFLTSGHGNGRLYLSPSPPPPAPPRQCRWCRRDVLLDVVVLAETGCTRPGARHVLVEAQVVLLVELAQSLGEARSSRPSSGSRALSHQGFNVATKFLEMYEFLGSTLQCLETSMAGKYVELFHGSWSKVPEIC